MLNVSGSMLAGVLSSKFMGEIDTDIYNSQVVEEV